MEFRRAKQASDAEQLLLLPPRPRDDLLLLRQAYLRSYQFTVRESFSDRLRRNLMEAGGVGKAFLSEIVDQVFDVRRVLRYFRSRLRRAAMSPVRSYFSGRYG
ncbi:hypothetical protein OPV22_021409 [Ensete ventricosum]|uniref:Uncharacterized protein n=1 Tax=Ensete ventricosum TaxID=4639 RepID=A0AAV8QQI9_ENSVE|nr:hypothetical protein OPV22_021409 [Ensete ventricosum]